MMKCNNLEPGVIRQCPSGNHDCRSRWVMVTPTTWRWMESERVSECITLSDDPSPVIGRLPPGELDSTTWREEFRLPKPCIYNAAEYEPVWDCCAGSSEAGRWLSRHIGSGNLFDIDGRSVELEPPKPAAGKTSASVAARFFKKYW